MKIYKPTIVSQLQEFYGELLYDLENDLVIRDRLRSLSVMMWEGLQESYDPVFTQINNYNKGHLGRNIEELKKIDLDFNDCLTTISHEYGFNSWQHVENLGSQKYDVQFELAINNIIEGNLEALMIQVNHNANLISQKSQYGHQATLLHYVASNGIELWRQQVPYNLLEITEFLLGEGADPKAKMMVYGGEYDVLSLLVSSAHPHDAGIIDEMKELLQ